MDLLDRVAAPGADLLERVDDILMSAGAPGEHPVWALVQRAGVMPSTAFAGITTLASADFSATEAQAAAAASAIRRSVEVVEQPLDSRGAAADGFRSVWSGLKNEIAGDEGLAGRLAATSAALDRVGDWAAITRRTVAGEVGACLGSAEAVLVRSRSGAPTPDETRAAADIGACVLGAVVDAVADGWRRYDEWSHLAEEAPVRSGATQSMPLSSHIEIR